MLHFHGLLLSWRPMCMRYKAFSKNRMSQWTQWNDFLVSRARECETVLVIRSPLPVPEWSLWLVTCGERSGSHTGDWNLVTLVDALSLGESTEVLFHLRVEPVSSEWYETEGGMSAKSSLLVRLEWPRSPAVVLCWSETDLHRFLSDCSDSFTGCRWLSSLHSACPTSLAVFWEQLSRLTSCLGAQDFSKKKFPIPEVLSVLSESDSSLKADCMRCRNISDEEWGAALLADPSP